MMLRLACGAFKEYSAATRQRNQRRANARSHTPCPSRMPRCSNFVNGRCSGRGAKPCTVFTSEGSLPIT